MTTRIRTARPDDQEAVARLAAQFGTSFPFDPAAFERSFTRLLHREGSLMLVAESDGVVIGYLLAFRHETFFANGPVLWVEEIMVDPAFRRQGIGRILMEAAEVWARENDCRLIALATRRAAPFYGALAYQESAQYFRKLLPAPEAP